jgi:fibronectin type 3 domain-containing protein
MKHFLISTFCLLGAFIPALGQENTPAIKVLGKATQQSIMLRWAPVNAVAWQRLNEYGYEVERVTIVRNGQVLDTPEKQMLTDIPIKARPLADWQALVEADENAAVAAQAIFGETFELTENYSSDIMQVVQKSQELELRFSFAVFAADQSFEVAQMAGLALVDHTPRSDEKYLYRIKSAVPADVEEITMGFTYLGLEDFAPLPKISGLQAQFGDRAVMLSWERENYDGIYNSFILEKSADGGINYTTVNDKPIINSINEDLPNVRSAHYFDSLSQNNKTYYYRVRGIDAFGEKSPPSDSVAGSGFIPIAAAPNITEWNTDNTRVYLAWQFPAEGVACEGFRVERSRMEAGPYTTLLTTGRDERTFTDSRPLSSNYYRVVVFNDRAQRPSQPVFVQLEDSIPPAIPAGLSAVVDSAGVVSLTWDRNSEDDLLGYRLYRANFKNAEFSQVTREAVARNAFTDTINTNTLTSSVYYKVSAVDLRYNESQQSALLKLSRPSTLPPAPPVFKNIRSMDEGIQMRYIKSFSPGVQHYDIYRRGGEQGWLLLARREAGDSAVFTDRNVSANTPYHYTITAIDSGGQESRPAAPVAASYTKTMSDNAPQALQVTADRSAKAVVVRWEYELPALEFRIYRKKGDEGLELFKAVPGSDKVLYDRQVQINNSYVYGVQAVTLAGLRSKIVFSTINF